VASLIPLKEGSSNKMVKSIIDVICLYSIVLGMSASLGAGIYSITGGLDEIFNIPKSNLLIGCVGAFIIASFILSAISGLQKGIKWLSTINIVGFILLAIFIFFVSYPVDILKIAFSGLTEYFVTFPQRSLNMGSEITESWTYDWSIFYWANWFAWAPIAALFLGKISRGYTVRQYINYNLILPSIFAIVWISIFSGATLHANLISENLLFETMTLKGEESVMYGMLHKIGFSKITIPISLVLIYISYVTAADSNISAMSAMSEKEKNNSTQEASIYIKIIWGLIIGSLTYIMLSTKGLDGIRILSLLGGFPALFIIIFASISLVRFLFNKKLLRPKEYQ